MKEHPPKPSKKSVFSNQIPLFDEDSFLEETTQIIQQDDHLADTQPVVEETPWYLRTKKAPGESGIDRSQPAGDRD